MAQIGAFYSGSFRIHILLFYEKNKDIHHNQTLNKLHHPVWASYPQLFLVRYNVCIEFFRLLAKIVAQILSDAKNHIGHPAYP